MSKFNNYETMFSFIVPIYNCEQYIKKCVESIECIEGKDYEVVLVNDGSTDNTEYVCNNLLEKYGNITYYYQENRGVSVARNIGLNISNGKYVIFVDADDTIDGDKMNKLFDVIRNDDSIDIAFFGISFDYYHNGKKYRSDVMKLPLIGKKGRLEWGKQLKKLYGANALSSMCNKITKKDLFINNQMTFREDMFFYEDLEVTLRVLSKCGNAYFYDSEVYRYRQTEDEGNAERRLLRIPHISELANQIDDAIKVLLDSANDLSLKDQADYILINLYLTWAREKIMVSNLKEIKIIQKDFIQWFKQRNMNISAEQKREVYMLQKRSPVFFYCHKLYITFRHRVAVCLKSRGLINR